MAADDPKLFACASIKEMNWLRFVVLLKVHKVLLLCPQPPDCAKYMSVAKFPFQVKGINQVEQNLSSAEDLVQFHRDSLENCMIENKQKVPFLHLSLIKIKRRERHKHCEQEEG